MSVCNTHTHTTGSETKARVVAGTGTGTGTGRAEERRGSARSLTRAVAAMWETGETWVERQKNVRQERVGSVVANPE